jgi:hypothetical protein
MYVNLFKSRTFSYFKILVHIVLFVSETTFLIRQLKSRHLFVLIRPRTHEVFMAFVVYFYRRPNDILRCRSVSLEAPLPQCYMCELSRPWYYAEDVPNDLFYQNIAFL